MSKPKLLTKSRHKLASECPTKLYYASDPSTYWSNKIDDRFLRALARGGFQVGEIAKLYYPGGHEVTSLDYDTSVAETEALLSQENVVIYEAAVRFKDLFVRVDVLRKIGDRIELIEVKSKSWENVEPPLHLYKRDWEAGRVKLKADWAPYVHDVAFQAFVLQNAFPKFKIVPYLCMLDKRSLSTVEGLNQKFFLTEVDGRTRVEVAEGVTLADLGEKILTSVNMESEVAAILSGNDQGAKTRAQLKMASFESEIWDFVKMYQSGVKAPPVLSSACKGCEFRIKADKEAEGFKSGFKECWSEAAGLGAEEFSKPMIMELWSYSWAKHLKEGRYFISELTEEDIEPEPRSDGASGWSAKERRWVQVQKAQSGDSSSEVDIEGLGAQMSRWKYPLHFIDFETSGVAIPFNAHRRPYENIAFQFSHHVVHEDGSIEHAGEWINRERGKFPNYEFVRQLKAQLEKDDGTIFRYAAHENTILVQIYRQLMAEDEGVVEDREELLGFIRSITQNKDEWTGERNMVDMLELVKGYYYHPAMKGSNSIKQVLPAILGESSYLQEKYSKPIYGNGHDVTSLNFENYVWVQRDLQGNLIDPYKQLEPVHERFDAQAIDDNEYLVDAELADGGAAMMAYAMMQFTQMGDEEVERVCKALLRYCELDTLAMVMIYEAWREMISEVEEAAQVG